MDSETISLSDTQEIDLLDKGIPASSLDLSGLNSKLLLQKVRQANIAWVAMTEAGRKSEAHDMDGNIEVLYRELQHRRSRQELRGRTGSFLGRLLGWS